MKLIRSPYEPFLRQVICCAALCLLSACQSTANAPDRASVSLSLTEKSGFSLKADGKDEGVIIPEGVSLADGLTEEEAIKIALWNNAAFKETLTNLDISRGDLVQAGLLPNPDASFTFEMAEKPFKYALELPIESLWLRRIKIKSMRNEADRNSMILVQAGLDLIRDVRQAYADALLAQQRSGVSEEAKALRTHIADLAERRFSAGDITQQEVGTAKIGALQATQDATKASYDVPITMEKLRNLMGMGFIPDAEKAALAPDPLPACDVTDENALVMTALENRPDMQAALKNIAAAEQRVTLAKTGWVKFTGVADATSGNNGHELGPSMKFSLPLFNHNQGAVILAEAELEKAKLAHQTLSQQIAMEIRQSYLQYRQICQEWVILHDEVRPQVEAAIERSKTAYQEGDIAYLMVLEATHQLFDNHFRQVQLDGDLRRVWAQLERNSAKKLNLTQETISP